MRRGVGHTHFASRRIILNAHGRRFDPRKTPESEDSCESAQTDPKRGRSAPANGIPASRSKPPRRPSDWDTWCYRFRGSKNGMKTRTRLRRVRRYRTPPAPVRFLNRTGHKIPPSIQANRALEWRVLQGLRKIYPITHVGYEVVKARGNSSFSPVMVGQPWQMHRLAALLPLESRRGWDQAQWRFTLGLQTPPKRVNHLPPATPSMAWPWLRAIFCTMFSLPKPRGTMAVAGKVPARLPKLPLRRFNGFGGFAGRSMAKIRFRAAIENGSEERPLRGGSARGMMSRPSRPDESCGAMFPGIPTRTRLAPSLSRMPVGIASGHLPYPRFAGWPDPLGCWWTVCPMLGADPARHSSRRLTQRGPGGRILPGFC